MKKIPPKLLIGFLSTLLCFSKISTSNGQSSITKSTVLKNTSEVLASAGGTAKFSSIQLEWTLGESFIGEATDQAHLYTIGFHQPTLKVKPEFQLDEASQKEIDLFPNPVTNSLNVKFNIKNAENAGKFNFVLTDMTGKLIFEKEIDSNSQTQSVDIPNLPTSIYQVKISTDSGKLSRTFKIVKTN